MKQVIGNTEGDIIYECDADTLSEAVEQAIREGVSLVRADFFDADLRGANFRGGNFRWCDFRGADLRGVDFTDAHVVSPYVRNSRFDAEIPDCRRVVPKEGEFIGWKKCCNGVIVKLLIPADAERSNAFSRKCRASKAIVLEVIGADIGRSICTDDVIEYRVGDTVYPDKWDSRWWWECTNGIHFFMSKEEAEKY